jgi:Tfp pilus assembly protein PilN
MKMIDVSAAVTMIKNSNGKFFTVSFIKRSDNSIRTMNCRLGVKKGLKNAKRNRRNAGLVTVYDMTNQGYRNINISGLRDLKINGQTFLVI